MWSGVENKVPLGTYNFTFASVYMMEDEVFIMRNQIDLLSESISQRTLNRMKADVKSIS